MKNKVFISYSIHIQLEIKKAHQISQILLLLRISVYASSDSSIIIMQL